MVQKVSSLRAEGLSPSDCDNDLEEKEISDDDDDDRNHKHRRRETESQSMERDPVDQVLIRPNRKRNKSFGNGQPYRENDSQSSEPWKRRSTFAPNRANQSFFPEMGPGRGRGKDFRPWIPRDPRFSSADMASPMVPPLPVLPNLFAGRGLPVISNPQGSSWSPYGLMPGVLNSGLDPLHPLGLRGTFRPPIGLQQNMGIMRQRCRDFEERGFCLRGDMCPMEHGVNRIVVDDVQSLSQFNLPVSLSNEHQLASSAALTSVTASSSKMANSSSLHSKSGKNCVPDGGLGNGVSTISASADGSDFYDPDQPLWANDCPGTSTALQQLNSSEFGETEVLDSRIEHHNKNNTTAVGPQGTSSKIWGRVGSKNKSEMKGVFGSYDQNKGKEMGSQGNDTSLKIQYATQPSIRKPTQKALRTLCVSGIPKKDDTIEALLSHFKKFGEIIDIYIPHTGDRAFVQFSKREEAEGALNAPDAVMGNRFIKLFWANRDRIPEDIPGSASKAPHPSVAQKGKELQNVASKSSFPITSASPSPHTNIPKPIIAPPPQKKPGNSALLEEFRKRQESFNKKRDALQRELAEMAKKAAGSKGEVASDQVSKRQKAGAIAESAKAGAIAESAKAGAITESAKAGAIAESAKAETLNSSDSAGSKGEAPSEEVAKTLNVTAVANTAKPETTNSRDSDSKIALPQAVAVESKKSVEKLEDQSSSKLPTTVVMNQQPSLKQAIHPLASPRVPFGLNRFKLDNRPTAFRVPAPLPAGLQNINVLKEHFSAYGELSSVEIEEGDSSDSAAPNNCSALINFANRRSAEKAFINGKCWQGHTLQLIWATSNNTSNGNKEKPVYASEVSATGGAESGNLETKNRNEEYREKGEDLRCSSSSVSGDS